MPDELCRNCGDSLHDLHKCVACNKVVCMMCKKCGKKTDEQFHIDCLYSNNDYSEIMKSYRPNFSNVAMA